MFTDRYRLLAAVLVLAACRTTPPTAVDPVLASYIPEGVTALGGADLAQLRASPIFAKLSQASALQPLQNASNALVAYDTRGLLLISRGDSSPVALAGSPDLIRAATARHQLGATGASELVQRANAAAAHPLWLVVSGTATLPLTANAANLNRFIHMTDYLSVTAQLASTVDLEITASCRTPEQASQFEESLRALVSLASATRSRQSALLDSVRIRRDPNTVTVNLSAAPEDLTALF